MQSTAQGLFPDILDEMLVNRGRERMRALLQDRLMTLAAATPALAARRRELEKAVEQGHITAPRAVDELIALMEL